MDADRSTALIRDMRESLQRLQTMVSELHPTDEADPAKAEIIADLQRELDSMRGGIKLLERVVED
jgi:DNA-binding transcriptional regulator GbsR (MarR family)